MPELDSSGLERWLDSDRSDPNFGQDRYKSDYQFTKRSNRSGGFYSYVGGKTSFNRGAVEQAKRDRLKAIEIAAQYPVMAQARSPQ